LRLVEDTEFARSRGPSKALRRLGKFDTERSASDGASSSALASIGSGMVTIEVFSTSWRSATIWKARRRRRGDGKESVSPYLRDRILAEAVSL
jgi:hypothetical protein